MIHTGILGGSFNPIHKGHIALAQIIYRSKLVDELWLLVSPQNPLKQNQDLLDEQFRLHLARLATQNYPFIQVSDFEFHLPRPSYMIHTLEALKKSYLNRTFSLIIGADNWINFNQWYHSEEILKEYHLIVYPRTGYTINTKELPQNVEYLELPLFPISSTEIRQKILLGEDVSEWLDPLVEKEVRNSMDI